MTIILPEPGSPRRPHGPRDPGDAWVEGPAGKFWGRFGAAGLLAVDPDRGVLLQHRVAWSHFGGTWALPGGARHDGESAADGALREAHEEAGVPTSAVVPRLESVFDVGYWSYTTLVADVVEPFQPVINDPESLALAWVQPDVVGARPLHPGFEAAWDRLRELVAVRPALVVDAANVVGAIPDGWWRDRPAAAERLLKRIDALALAGIEADGLGLPESRWFPEVSVVLEGAARAVDIAVPRVTVVRAEGHGDDAIVAETRRLVAAGRQVTVVSSDKELLARVAGEGARTHGVRWLLDRLPA
ncbi:NUDIX hydrolase [Microbacterium sp. X-17]|uniref:NUDIX hydrolase n=1 Tax=Microbacterium sp. X-17 TaxID=3144404 RepID=UPI0031F57283